MSCLNLCQLPLYAPARLCFHWQDQSCSLEILCVVLIGAWSLNLQVDLGYVHAEHEESLSELDHVQSEGRFECVSSLSVAPD